MLINAITSLNTTSSLFQIYSGDLFNTLQLMKQISYWVYSKWKYTYASFNAWDKNSTTENSLILELGISGKTAPSTVIVSPSIF